MSEKNCDNCASWDTNTAVVSFCSERAPCIKHNRWRPNKPRFPVEDVEAPTDKPMDDAVEHPSHYTSHPSGVECIQITEHMNFNLGNSLKYIWRTDLKRDDSGIEDLKKARWYIDREISRRENESKS